ncbi:MAG: hypothetical protein ACYDBQ_08560 [Thermoplasmatota archaeon]
MARPNVTVKNQWNEWNDLSGNYLPRRLKVPAVAPPQPAQRERKRSR